MTQHFVFLSFALCESGTPLLVISLFIPLYGAVRVEEFYGYFPLLKTEDQDEINKLFFHDLVNKTHGMKLFLKNRIEQKKGMSEGDLKELVNEVESLQLLIKDHFKEHHKNWRSGIPHGEKPFPIRTGMRALAKLLRRYCHIVATLLRVNKHRETFHEY